MSFQAFYLYFNCRYIQLGVSGSTAPLPRPAPDVCLKTHHPHQPPQPYRGRTQVSTGNRVCLTFHWFTTDRLASTTTSATFVAPIYKSLKLQKALFAKFTVVKQRWIFIYIVSIIKQNFIFSSYRLPQILAVKSMYAFLTHVIILTCCCFRGCDNVIGVELCFRNKDHVVIVMQYFPHEKFHVRRLYEELVKKKS